MKLLSKIVAFIIIVTILGFEASHVAAHIHEGEHSKDSIVLELGDNDLEIYTHRDDHEHAPHKHLNLITKNERYSFLNISAPEFENKNIDVLSSKKELILSVRRAFYQIKSYEREHSYLYKYPFQFRNRFLLI